MEETTDTDRLIPLFRYCVFQARPIQGCHSLVRICERGCPKDDLQGCSHQLVSCFSLFGALVASKLIRPWNSYLETHNMVRNITGVGEGKGPYISFHDGMCVDWSHNTPLARSWLTSGCHTRRFPRNRCLERLHARSRSYDSRFPSVLLLRQHGRYTHSWTSC